MNYLRSGRLVTPGLTENMLQKLKIEAQYFGLQDLRDKIEVAVVMQSSPDDEIVIDARGTKFNTTRKVIAKSQNCQDHYIKSFLSLLDPQSPKLLKCEDDGCYKIDSDHRYIEWLLSACQCESYESYTREWAEFCDKYGENMMWQWYDEFENQYR